MQARIPRVVIGCMNPKAGCAGSVLDMLHEEGFNHQVQTDINVCQEECSGMLSRFFKDLRKKRAGVKGPEAVAGCRSGESGIASCFLEKELENSGHALTKPCFLGYTKQAFAGERAGAHKNKSKSFRASRGDSGALSSAIRSSRCDIPPRCDLAGLPLVSGVDVWVLRNRTS